LTQHRRSRWGYRRRDRGSHIPLQLLARGRRLLGSNPLGAFVVGRIVVEALKLELELSFSLSRGFDLRSLGSQSGFLLFRLSLCSLPPSLLFRFLDFSLFDLFF
jgi:hypothetical protein